MQSGIGRQKQDGLFSASDQVPLPNVHLNLECTYNICRTLGSGANSDSEIPRPIARAHV
jgi:hypothetical protein